MKKVVDKKSGAVTWVEDHPYEKLREMPPIVLIQLMRNVWDKLYAIQNTLSNG